METLQLDKLLEPEFTEADTFSAVLPSGPCKILQIVKQANVCQGEKR